MNYLIESGFMDDDSLSTILWSERLLYGFASGVDDRLGLNKCSAAERKIVKVLSKCFQVTYVESPDKCYLQRTPDTRCPYLTIRDYLSKPKLEKHFASLAHKFQSNVDKFPLEFKSYSKLPETESFLKFEHKPTNKEVSQHEMSLHTVRSRNSSVSSESRSSMIE